MDDLELKLPAETRDAHGFTKKENEEIEKYLTRPKVNSEGAFAAEVKRQRQNGTYGYYNKPIDERTESNGVKPNPRAVAKNKKKTDVMDYINKKIDMYEGDGDAKRYVNKSLNKFENRTDNPNIVTFNPTTQLFTNKDRTIAIQDYNVANDYNKRLGVKPNHPTEATPEQFGKFAERLERERQMRGEPTNVQMFEKNFNQKIKPFVKKKISTPIEAVKINMDTYEPFIPIDIPKRDPQMIENEKRFNRMQDEIKQEKNRINNSGLAGLIGGAKNGE